MENAIDAVNAAATDAAAAPEGGTANMIIMCLMILGIMYFMMIRPNKKRMDEYKKMLDGVKIGAKVICAGGIHGTVKEIGSDTADVEIADKVVIKVAKNSIAKVM